MKQLTLTILTVLSTVTTFGQITTTKVATKVEETATKPYDSTQNFLGKNVNQYLGQELYLKGMPESHRKYGYKDFYIDYNNKDIYKCCDSYNSKYSELEGKYFSVLEIIKHPKINENEYYRKKLYLKLKEKLSQEIVFFEYDVDSEESFPFIVVGFFEKLKKQIIGKKFVFGSTKLIFGEDELDIKSGNPIIFKLGEKWECFDLTIEKQFYDLSILLKDKAGQNLSINYKMVVGPDKFHDVYTEKEAEKYKTKFGLSNWNTILQGKVTIGMTKEMCKISWGEPEDINNTITKGRKFEQWVYNRNYLYFVNGKLTIIQ